MGILAGTNKTGITKFTHVSNVIIIIIMKITILYLVAESYPTFRADVTVLFGKYLPKYGIKSDIVTSKNLDSSDADHWGGGDSFLCHISGGTANKHFITFIHGIKHMLKADPKYIHAIQVRDMPMLAAIGLLIAHFKGMKFFYWMSYPIPEGQIQLAQDYGLSGGVGRFLFRLISGYVGRFLLYHIALPRADHVFVQSDQMKENMIEYGICTEKMTPVPMGVDIEALQLNNITPSDDRRLVGRRVLVYMGTLDARRKIELLFEMLNILKIQFPAVLLVLVGDASDEVQRRSLKMNAETSGVSDHLICTGWLPRDEAWRYVLSAEVALSPFPRSYLLDSASPTKLPEYFALGVPVVCNDNPDQEHVIRQSGAGICVPYTATDFASAVINILSLDKNERSEMVKKGKDYVSQHRDYGQISSNLADTYQNIFMNNVHGRK
jgi:glycosyltransferase involved in cell wall biosynthesis